MSIARFILFSLLIAAFLVLTAYVAQQYWLPSISFPAMSVAVLISLLTTNLAYSINFKNLFKGNRSFISALLVAMTSKMIIGIISILYVAIQYTDQIKEYVTAYFLSYFAFTAFEVYSLMRKLRA